MATLLSR